MFYIYASRGDDVTKYYWNRRKNEWQLALRASCYYPTRKGVNRIYRGMTKDGSLLGRRFHEIGWKRVEDDAARIRLAAWGHGGQTT
jgi:hypothetical protein